MTDPGVEHQAMIGGVRRVDTADTGGTGDTGDTGGTGDTADISIDDVVSRFSDLPTLAPVAVEVIRLAEDDDASIGDMADVISNDPGLAARLLRLANSAAYNRGQEVTNLRTAAGLMGIHTLKMVTLGFTLVADLSTEQFDSTLVWRRSLATSVLARQFAGDCNAELADDAFVAGLLANIGKLALAGEAAYTDWIKAFGPWMSRSQELDLLGFTSDEVTARILDGWGLPPSLSAAVRHRGGPLDDVCQTELAAILRVADNAATLILVGDDAGRASAMDSLTASAAAHLGLTIGEVELIINDLGPELNDIAGTFQFEAISSRPVEEIIRTAQSQLARLGLDLASMLSEEKHRNESLIELNRQLKNEASTDALTGLPNRRTFDAYLSNQIAGRIRNPRQSMLGLIMFDLDKFKSINDSFGHSVGDEVLDEFGRRLLECSRRGELAARIGGEEFALVLPDVESAAELGGAAERIRGLIGSQPVSTAVGPLTVTASVGGAVVRSVGADTSLLLFQAADKALYAAKEAGRDRVEISTLVH